MTPKILFVCQHGSAKSVVAALHLQELAASRGIALECLSAGIDPDDTIPPHVVAGLTGDGLDFDGTKPRLLTSTLVDAATHVVSFAGGVTPHGPTKHVITWDDIPAVSDGYAAARDAIVARLQPLLDSIVSDDLRG
jgi:arsenate reductase (thioredoxin)